MVYKVVPEHTFISIKTNNQMKTKIDEIYLKKKIMHHKFIY